MINFDRSRRLLFGALALSSLLHLLALAGGVWPRPLPPLSPVALQASLVSPEPAVQPSPAPATPVQASAKQQLPPASGASRKASPAVAPVAGPAPRHEPTPVPAGPATPAIEEGGERAMAPPAQSTAATSPSATPAPAADVAPPVGAISADSLRQYRIDLAVAARRFRVYPAVARARSWEGVAEVGLVLSPALSAPQLRLLRSSGHEVLDEAALRMLSRAVAATPLPDGLRGAGFELTLPVRFSLEE